MDLNKITLDLAGSEELSEAASRMAAGDKFDLSCTLGGRKYKLEGTIDEIDPAKMLIASITTEEAEEKPVGSAQTVKEKEPIDEVMAAV